MEEVRSPFKIVIGKPTGQRPSGRPMRRWEDNIIMNLKEIGVSMRNWVDSAMEWSYKIKHEVYVNKIKPG